MRPCAACARGGYCLEWAARLGANALDTAGDAAELESAQSALAQFQCDIEGLAADVIHRCNWLMNGHMPTTAPGAIAG